MIIILWITAILMLALSVLLLVPGLARTLVEAMNKIVFAINSEDKIKAGAAIAALLISLCSFFLIYYYTR